jgi:ABC-type branched-subunit amino acid transport system substrate-binding protein
VSPAIIIVTWDMPITVNNSCADVNVCDIFDENRVFFISVCSFDPLFHLCWQLMILSMVAAFSKVYSARWKKQSSIKRVITA